MPPDTIGIRPALYLPVNLREERITMATQSRSLEGHQLRREPEQRLPHVVGGAPHGFGVWIDGRFHRVDIGALGTVIDKLTEELEAARKELVEQSRATHSVRS
jgi:hypothetical protein